MNDEQENKLAEAEKCLKRLQWDSGQAMNNTFIIKEKTLTMYHFNKLVLQKNENLCWNSQLGSGLNLGENKQGLYKNNYSYLVEQR